MARPAKKAKRARKKAETADALLAIPDAPVQIDGVDIIGEQEALRRELFAQTFVQTGSMAKAAAKCGYGGTPKSLKVSGYRLMQVPEVRARILQIQRDMRRELAITTRDVLAELSRIAFLDPRSIFDDRGELKPMNMLDEDVARAIGGYKVTTKTFGEDGESVEKEVKFISKDAALDKLGKHLGLWRNENEEGKITPEMLVKAMLEARERVNRHLAVDRKRALEVQSG